MNFYHFHLFSHSSQNHLPSLPTQLHVLFKSIQFSLCCPYARAWSTCLEENPLFYNSSQLPVTPQLYWNFLPSPTPRMLGFCLAGDGIGLVRTVARAVWIHTCSCLLCPKDIVSLSSTLSPSSNSFPLQWSPSLGRCDMVVPFWTTHSVFSSSLQPDLL